MYIRRKYYSQHAVPIKTDLTSQDDISQDQLQKSIKKAKLLLQINKKKMSKRQFQKEKLNKKKLSFPNIIDPYQEIKQSNLHLLRNQLNKEKQSYLILKNRIKYFSNCNENNLKVKKNSQQKYDFLVQQRNKKLQEKKQLLQKIQLIDIQNQDYLRKIRNKTTQQKLLRTSKINDYKIKLFHSFKLMKQSKKLLKSISVHQNSQILNKNKLKATTIKENQIQLIKAKKNNFDRIKNIGRRNHDQLKMKELYKKQKLKKKNCYLYKKMLQFEQLANNSKRQSQNSVRRIQSILSLRNASKSSFCSQGQLSFSFIRKY